MKNDQEPEAATGAPSEQPETSLEQADVKLGAKLAQERHHPVVRVLGAIGKVGDQEPLYALGVLLVGSGMLACRKRLVKSGALMLAAVAAADASKSFTKRLVKRTRPRVLLEEGRYAAGGGGSPQKPEQSFPSGHVAGSIAAARAVTRIFPEARPWPELAAVGIGVTRLLKGEHWPLDTLAGAVLGLLAEATTNALLRRVFPPEKKRA